MTHLLLLSKKQNQRKTPSVKLKSMPSTLQYGTPRELEERISDETPTISFKSEINSVPIAPNSTKNWIQTIFNISISSYTKKRLRPGQACLA